MQSISQPNGITTVNFHVTKACNYRCEFCYARFNDIHEKSLSFNEQKRVIEILADSNRFKKINFAGGEPTLLPHLKELIKHAKRCGFKEVSMVTNLSRVDEGYFSEIYSYLDILAISIDSVDMDTNLAIGRAENLKVLDTKKVLKIIEKCKEQGIYIKINSVVSSFNKGQNLAWFTNTASPDRWKVLEVTNIGMQNDKEFKGVCVSDDEFKAFVTRNKNSLNSNIKMVVERQSDIIGSYIMVNELGEMYDNSGAEYGNKANILKYGVDACVDRLNVSYEKFIARSGFYEI